MNIENADSFTETEEVCPECGGTIYENRIAPSTGREVVEVQRVCENTKYDDSSGDCTYYEEESECPECGSELSGETHGPDRLTGARAGRVNCTECEFGFNWSE